MIMLLVNFTNLLQRSRIQCKSGWRDSPMDFGFTSLRLPPRIQPRVSALSLCEIKFLIFSIYKSSTEVESMSAQVDRRSSNSSGNGAASESKDFSDYTVEQLFQKVSIKEIQNLNQTYKQDALNTKQELQSLVSEKYRDLISITEGIDEKCKDFETNLAGLAFKSTNFVKFNNPNYYNVNIKSFTDELNELNASDRKRIVNDLVFDQLLLFDLKLQKNDYQGSPFSHTSNFIYYAKLFFVLESIFSEEVHSNAFIESNVLTMKQNFISFLRYQFSKFNISSNSYFLESDMYDPKQSLELGKILSKSAINLVDDEDELEQDTPESSVELESKGIERYDINTLPIVNYLVAFLILSSNGSSILKSTVMFEFLESRYRYLDSLLSGIEIGPKSFDKINLFNILKFIENTFGYVENYFESTDSTNVLIKHITSSTKSWEENPDFKDYEDQIKTKFNIDSMFVELLQSSIKDLTAFKEKFLDLILHFFSKLAIDEFGRTNVLNQNLTIFKSLLFGVKRLQSSCLDQGFKSQTVELVSNSSNSILNRVLNLLINNIATSYEAHLSLLKNLDPNTRAEPFGVDTLAENYNLFSADFVGLISQDLSFYYDMITQASQYPMFSFTSPEHDPCKRLSTWFKNDQNYGLLLDTTETSRTKFSLYECCKYISEPLSGSSSENTWGSFNKDVLLSQFEDLKQRLKLIFWNKLESFIEEIRTSATGCIQQKDLHKTYTVTKSLLVLKGNLSNGTYEIADLTLRINQIDQQLNDCYEFIIEQVPEVTLPNTKISFMDQYEAVIDSILNETVAEKEVIAPSRKLSTLMFSLSRQFLNPSLGSYEGDYQNGILFNEGREIFAKHKKSMFLNKLIPKVIELASSKEGKFSTHYVKIIYSNIIFLRSFIGDELVSYVEELSGLAEEDPSASDLEIIKHNIKKFYEVSKDTYFPLNA